MRLLGETGQLLPAMSPWQAEADGERCRPRASVPRQGTIAAQENELGTAPPGEVLGTGSAKSHALSGKTGVQTNAQQRLSIQPVRAPG